MRPKEALKPTKATLLWSLRLSQGHHGTQKQGGSSSLTQPADGAVVGLVAQGVSTGITQTEVSAGQNESVPEVRQANHTLVAVVTVLII